MDSRQITAPMRRWTRPIAAAALLSWTAAAGAAGDQVADEPGGDDGAPSRYVQVLGSGSGGGDAFERRVGAELVTFDSAVTDALVAEGWQPRSRISHEGFADHGERVRTFVAIAEALGLDPAVGAEQANWGTPQENGLMDRGRDLESVRYELSVARYDIAALNRHRVDALAVLTLLRDGTAAGTIDDSAEDPAATIDALVAEIADVDRRLVEIRARVAVLERETAVLESESGDAMTRAAPETPPQGWEFVNLDVNGDDVVDLADLDAARNGMRPEPLAGAGVDE